jgi:hypothetical protein
MKSLVVIFAATLVIGGYAWSRVHNASVYAYRLETWLPASSVAVSKQFKVFAGLVEVSPRLVDLGDTTYRLEDAWIEHRTQPRRVSVFRTDQEILPEFILCVRYSPIAHNPLLSQTGIRIKDKKSREVFDSPIGNVLRTEIGTELPANFTLRCDTREKEVVVELKKA